MPTNTRALMRQREGMDLRFNKISDIEPGVLSHLHSLRSLLLNDNRLRELVSGTFDGLRKLKYLYLYRNRIQYIEQDVFQGLEHLEQLTFTVERNPPLCNIAKYIAATNKINVSCFIVPERI
ncbi:hypothetical protein SFRURICE_007785 [Spodoptera frugiperda]|uniref:SFRICE_031759 n=1 Tax=Spodoptera frugiperda TaxID=7108 RepID=A0A2H1WLZ5_SPOFR|nr:hypothetical protein SFRURICE_007785 [Spodoptera frugiperda]